MFKIYKCEVRNKKAHNIKDGVIRDIDKRNEKYGHKNYTQNKKINGQIADDYTLYQYDLKDIETGNLFAMKTVHDIEIDDKPLYIGVEGDDIVAFSKNELSGEKKEGEKNYTLLETKTSEFTAKQIATGLLIFVMYMAPIMSLVTNFLFIKDWAKEIKKDYSNYPALIFQIAIGLVILIQIKTSFMAFGASSLAKWYSLIQSSTITTGALSFAVFVGGACYFKIKRNKNLEHFNNL